MKKEVVFEKLDKLDIRLGSIDSTLAAQHESLKDHIRRTEILESRIVPVEKHVVMTQGALKFIGILSLLAGIVEVFLWTKH